MPASARVSELQLRKQTLRMESAVHRAGFVETLDDLEAATAWWEPLRGYAGKAGPLGLALAAGAGMLLAVRWRGWRTGLNLATAVVKWTPPALGLWRSFKRWRSRGGAAPGISGTSPRT